MSKRKRRDRPKRLFKRPAGPMELAASVLADPELGRFLSCASPVQRALIYTALRSAVQDVGARRKCDVCGRAAETIRFVLAKPEEIGGMFDGSKVEGACLPGFALLCGKCREKPRATVLEAVLGKVSKYAPADLGPKPIVVGVPVGEVGGLAMPERTALEVCERCRKTIWINQDQRDQIGEDDGDPVFVCVDCAQHYEICTVPVMAEARP